MTPSPRQVSAQRRIAANKSWAMTPNRTERTARGYEASPASLEFHIARLRAEGVVREEDIEKNAASARRAYMQEIRAKGAQKQATQRTQREQERLEGFRARR
ncbi:hypothetical protein OIE13_17055 [Streptosporangium sp. NBC_01810]|uniref:hypothetical protein n=1 Tax=Streptosporangium sp. NBC_01810 TaxID=2975951 RepID=UPI002DD8BB87|nr:hypothetical protein [Streptosporangium sp. NBC_01810]WSA29436.1 hypothetical protein OIE13_17055 [Streptosporangium sp. NBC_01810]